MLNSFRDVIRHYGRVEMAADCRVDYGVVKQWDRRDRIPDDYWQAIVQGASERDKQGVTLELLAGLAAEKRHSDAEPAPERAA